MHTLLLPSGYQRLLWQRANPGQRLMFSRFTLCSSADFAYDPNYNFDFYGDILYMATELSMRWNSVSKDVVIISAFMEHNEPEGFVGSVLSRLYGVDHNNDPSINFTLSRGFESQYKPITVADKAAGSKFVFRLKLSIPDIYSVFDFSNIQQEYADPASYDNEYSINFPEGEMHDQALVQNHSEFNKPVYLHNEKNQWFGLHQAKRLDDPNFGTIDGGNTGDGYTYHAGTPPESSSVWVDSEVWNDDEDWSDT